MARSRKITHGVALRLIARGREEYIFLKKLSYALIAHCMNNLIGTEIYEKSIIGEMLMPGSRFSK